MIDFAIETERKEGQSPEKSIYQACLLRFRPIMMTTMAAMFGGFPSRWAEEMVRNFAGRWESPSWEA